MQTLLIHNFSIVSSMTTVFLSISVAAGQCPLIPRLHILCLTWKLREIKVSVKEMNVKVETQAHRGHVWWGKEKGKSSKTYLNICPKHQRIRLLSFDPSLTTCTDIKILFCWIDLGLIWEFFLLVPLFHLIGKDYPCIWKVYRGLKVVENKKG